MNTAHICQLDATLNRHAQCLGLRYFFLALQYDTSYQKIEAAASEWFGHDFVCLEDIFFNGHCQVANRDFERKKKTF